MLMFIRSSVQLGFETPRFIYAPPYVANSLLYRTCYAYDQITGERSSIALGMAAISWLAVRGLDVAFRSNQKVEPLVIWRFGERKVKAVDAVPFTGPLVFHPKLDVIEIFYLKKIERDYFAGRWIAFNYGDLTAMSTREVHEKARAWSSGKYSARAKRRSLEKRMVRRAVVLNNINRGSYQFVDGLFFGLSKHIFKIFIPKSSLIMNPETCLRSTHTANVIHAS